MQLKEGEEGTLVLVIRNRRLNRMTTVRHSNAMASRPAAGARHFSQHAGVGRGIRQGAARNYWDGARVAGRDWAGAWDSGSGYFYLLLRSMGGG